MNNSDIKLLLDFMKGVLKCQWDDDEHFQIDPIVKMLNAKQSGE